MRIQILILGLKGLKPPFLIILWLFFLVIVTIYLEKLRPIKLIKQNKTNKLNQKLAAVMQNVSCFLRLRLFYMQSSTLFRPMCAWREGIQDSLGLWIPRRGFRIPITGFHIFFRISPIPIVSSIRDFYSCFSDSTSKTFEDSGFHTWKSPASRSPLHG